MTLKERWAGCLMLRGRGHLVRGAVGVMLKQRGHLMWLISGWGFPMLKGWFRFIWWNCGQGHLMLRGRGHLKQW